MKQIEKINIKKLKLLVLELPKHWLLRDVLLLERDELEVNEFLTKVKVWLKILRSSK